MKIFSQKARFIPGTLLITGTSVGAGMLGLPGITGPSGAFPAFVITTVCFLIMLLTGLLFVEATLWVSDGSNLISMTKRFLGRWGQWISTFFFLFLYYCLMVAYISGGSPLLPVSYSAILFPTLFAILIYLGPKIVGPVNTLLMVLFGLSYFLLIGSTLPMIQSPLLEASNWPSVIFAAPVLFSAFGYHNIIPSLSTYLSRDREQLTKSVILGTFLSYVIYLFWQWAVIGSVPHDLLMQVQKEGVPITQVLEKFSQYPWLARLSRFFAFFALVTSLIGVSLSMVDFLADGLKISKKGLSRLYLVLLVFAPPTILASIYPDIFLTSLGIAGGIGEAILNSLIPIALVYVGQKRFKFHVARQWLASPLTLTILVLLTLIVMGLELYLLFVR